MRINSTPRFNSMETNSPSLLLCPWRHYFPTYLDYLQVACIAFLMWVKYRGGGTSTQGALSPAPPYSTELKTAVAMAMAGCRHLLDIAPDLSYRQSSFITVVENSQETRSQGQFTHCSPAGRNQRCEIFFASMKLLYQPFLFRSRFNANL